MSPVPYERPPPPPTSSVLGRRRVTRVRVNINSRLDCGQGSKQTNDQGVGGAAAFNGVLVEDGPCLSLKC